MEKARLVKRGSETSPGSMPQKKDETVNERSLGAKLKASTVEWKQQREAGRRGAETIKKALDIGYNDIPKDFTGEVDALIAEYGTMGNEPKAMITKLAYQTYVRAQGAGSLKVALDSIRPIVRGLTTKRKGN